MLLACFVIIYNIIGYFSLSYNYIALSIVLFVVIYSSIQIRFANKIINYDESFYQIITSIFNFRLIAPILVTMFLNFFDYYFMSILGILLFFLINKKKIIFSYFEVKKLLVEN